MILLSWSSDYRLYRSYDFMALWHTCVNVWADSISDLILVAGQCDLYFTVL